MENYKLGLRASMVTALINIVLAMVKMFAGIIGKSSAMLADGLHTLSDVVTTVVVMVGLKISSKEADEGHPYGHEKYESVFAKILSIVLLFTGIYIGYNAFKSLIQGDLTRPRPIALVAALVSIAAKEAMYWYTINIAKKIKSLSMEADAWHHRSDALSSIGTLIGILGARLGLRALDPIAGIIVSLMVIKVAFDLYIKSVKELVDESANEEIILKIKELTNSIQGVLGIKDIRTRIFGNRIFVDLEIYVNPNISVKAGHDIAEMVHDKLEKDICDIKHCMVHIEPYVER